LLPFSFHWYEGDEPPLAAVAVNVTEVPLHMLELLADILTVGVTAGVIDIVTLLDEAVTGEAHCAEEVNTQLTTSLLLKVELTKVGELLPALFPFTFHW
jgi:hypothetical protein